MAYRAHSVRRVAESGWGVVHLPLESPSSFLVSEIGLRTLMRARVIAMHETRSDKCQNQTIDGQQFLRPYCSRAVAASQSSTSLATRQPTASRD